MPRISPRIDDKRRPVPAFRLIPGAGIRKQPLAVEAITIPHTGCGFGHESGKVSLPVFSEGNRGIAVFQADVHTLPLGSPYPKPHAAFADVGA
jgi:hypothetical protein